LYYKLPIKSYLWMSQGPQHIAVLNCLHKFYFCFICIAYKCDCKNIWEIFYAPGKHRINGSEM